MKLKLITKFRPLQRKLKPIPLRFQLTVTETKTGIKIKTTLSRSYSYTASNSSNYRLTDITEPKVYCMVLQPGVSYNV